jgi:hypothetical protein
MAAKAASIPMFLPLMNAAGVDLVWAAVLIATGARMRGALPAGSAEQAAQTPEPWLAGSFLLESAGSGSDRMVDLFKTQPTGAR